MEQVMESIERVEETMDALHNHISYYDKRTTRIKDAMHELEVRMMSLKSGIKRAMRPLAEESPTAKCRRSLLPAFEAIAPRTPASRVPSASNPRITYVTKAAAAGDALALRRILTNGGDPNSRNSKGIPALHLAATRGHVQTVRTLLNRGANVDLQNPKRRLALHVATEKGHVNVVRQLLEGGSDVELKDGQGNSPLMLAVRGRQWQIVRLLVEKGANSNARDSQGESALMAAATQGDRKTVIVMLRNRKPQDVWKALSYVKNKSVLLAFVFVLREDLKKEGAPALFEAAFQGRVESMVVLLEAGVCIDNTDGRQRTALMFASGNGHLDCVKELVRRGACLDAVDELGYTALHYAAENGQESAVLALLTAGANVNKRSNAGTTPFDLARTRAVRNVLTNHSTHSA